MEKESKDRVKSIANLVASTAALVASITALYEAYDKSLERKSYEVLSEKIKEIQEQKNKHLEVNNVPIYEIESIISPIIERPSPLVDPPEQVFKIPESNSKSLISNRPQPIAEMPPKPSMPLSPPPDWNSLKDM